MINNHREMWNLKPQTPNSNQRFKTDNVLLAENILNSGQQIRKIDTEQRCVFDLHDLFVVVPASYIRVTQW